MVAVAIFLASLLAAAVAKPVAFGTLVRHEQRNGVPDGFTSKGAAPRNAEIKLRIALTQGNMAGLEKALYDVSTPGSALYGEHLSKEEVEAFVIPKPETIAAVKEWLTAKGINAAVISPAKDWMSFTTTVGKANALFDAEFVTFEHTSTGKSAIRTLAYSIPAELKGHLELVHPTITFPNPNGGQVRITSPLPADFVGATASNRSTLAVPSSCASTVTPACLQALYGIPTTPATQSSNRLVVTGYIDQYANAADLKTFLGRYRTDLSSSTTFTTQLIDGGANPQSSSQAGVEANLDVQYTIGVATGVPVAFLSVGDNFQDGDLEGFLDTVNYVSSESVIPHVMTTSYGQNENTISRALANNLCNAYMQLGARGTSILFASGDGGVAGSQSASCSTFVPTFPSGCPYMTSVGATTGISPERAATLSSGGFSNYFGIPSYQASAVAAYKSALGTTNSGKFNTTGRGFPDVAAQGQSYVVYISGSANSVSGTSCSSPVFASVIALVNDRLVAAGKSPLGFLNPFLYSNSAALNDITTGNNPGCSTNGFPAKTGWDPVTGLGTPNFAKLLTAAGL